MTARTDGATEAVLDLHRLLAEDTPLDVVRQLAVDRVGALLDGAAALWLDDDGVLGLAAFSHPDPALQAEMVTLTRGLRHGEHSFLRALGALERPTALTGAQVHASLDRMEPAYATFFGRHPVSAMLLQPLRIGGRTLGLLGVTRHTGLYDDRDVGLLGHIGYVLSVVVQALRLQEQQREALLLAQDHQAALARLAATDDLTSLLNRRGFAQHLAAATQRAGGAVGVLLLDLDDFKAVNDSFGHVAGDALLMRVAAVLEALLPAGSAIARTGGDEFSALLRAPTAQAVREAAQRFVADAPRTERVLGLDIPLVASVGLVVTPEGVPFDAVRVVQHADVAMYRAKRSARTGRAVRLVEYDAERDAPTLNRLPDAARLRAAIGGGELVLHYQRSVAVHPEDRAEHVEALVRWNRDGTLLAPAAFLPLAQEIGAMAELTEVVLDLAVAQLVRWRAAGRVLSVAVNVPVHTLVTGNLVADVVGRLTRAGLPVDALSLEVTETELVQAAGRDAVAAARAAGLQVAVDDFGTGYSSLAYLADIPFSSVKLDRALVAGLDQDQVRRLLVRHCVRFCHELGLQVVAEGVERAAEQDVLGRLGVDRLQGFHLHRPAPADTLFRPSGP